jgi:L-rhamnose mutarotase
MRICFLLKVVPERVEEYRARHSEVWPELQEALRETGWKNYSLFLREDGLLVGYLEAEDFARCCAAMKSYSVNERWQAEMAPFFENLEGVGPDDQMKPVPEVFHLD